MSSQLSNHTFDDYSICSVAEADYTADAVSQIYTRDRYFSSVEIINGTDIPIIIQDRLGIPQRILTEQSLYKRSRQERSEHYNTKHWPTMVGDYCLYINYSFSFIDDDIKEIYNTYRAMSVMSPVYRYIAEAIRYHMASKGMMDKVHTVRIQMRIDASELSKRDIFFIQELGLIISTSANGSNLPTHPESLADIQRIRTNNFTVDINTETDPAFVAIKGYVSTEHRQFDKLYVHVLGAVQEIPVIYDPTRGFDGIEVHSKRSVHDTTGSHQPCVKQYSYEDALKFLGVATNIHDALNVEKKRKEAFDREMANAEVRLKEMAQKIQLDKMDFDRDVLAQKAEDAAKLREHEQWLLNYKQGEEQRRREYEERILKLKHQQLEKDLQMRQLTEDYQRVKMEKELYHTDFRNRLETMKSTLSFGGIVLNFVTSVIKLIPMAKPT